MKPTSQELDKINQFTKIPLTENDVEVYRNLMIDTLPVPSHGIKISELLMRKFFEDANKGVPQMMVHDTSLLPVGKVYNGELVLEQVNSESVLSLYGSFYIPLNRPVTGFPELNTNDLVNMVNDGVLTDTSIGFSASRFTCSICNNDIRDYINCPHVPGVEYPVTQPDGTITLETCWAIAEGTGSLEENSLVYNGACDRASILSKDSKTIGNKEVTFIANDIKKVALDAKIAMRFSKYHGLAVYSDKPLIEYLKLGDDSMPNENDILAEEVIDPNTPAISTEDVQEESVINEPEASEDVEDELIVDEDELFEEVEEVEELLPLVESVDMTNNGFKVKLSEKDIEIAKLKAEIVELKKAEAIAVQYHTDLVNKAIQSGIKLHGNFFKTERYEKFFRSLTLDELKETILDYEKELASKFGSGRMTVSDAVKPMKESVEYQNMSLEEKRDYLNDETEKFMKTNEGKNFTFREAFNLVRTKYEKESEF